MSHSRYQIAAAIESILNAVPILSGRVHTNVWHALSEAKLPAVVIYTNRESSRRDNLIKSAGGMARTLSAEIYVLASGNSANDQTDEFCVAIEKAMAADYDLGIGVDDSYLESSDITKTVVGNNDAYALNMAYTIKYRTLVADPETIV